MNANRTNALGNLVPTGGTWPLLLRESNRLGAPARCTTAGEAGCIPETVSYPLTATLNNNVAIFDPDIQLSYTKSWQVGFQCRRSGLRPPCRATARAAVSFGGVDLSLKKQFPLGGRRSFEITYDINNLFNNINFTPVFSNANLNSTTVFQTNAHYTDINQSYDPGGRLGQIIVRFNG